MSENKLIEAYTHLMENLYKVMDDTIYGIADAMEVAKEKTSQFGGEIQHYTQEELDHIEHAVMRDIEHAARFSPEIKDPDSLTEWLKFDIELLENFALEQFLNIADKTRIELAKLAQDAAQYHPYKAGDLTGPGTFTCDTCNKQIAFKSPSVIPECPECGGNAFTRC